MARARVQSHHQGREEGGSAPHPHQRPGHTRAALCIMNSFRDASLLLVCPAKRPGPCCAGDGSCAQSWTPPARRPRGAMSTLPFQNPWEKLGQGGSQGPWGVGQGPLQRGEAGCHRCSTSGDVHTVTGRSHVPSYTVVALSVKNEAKKNPILPIQC